MNRRRVVQTSWQEYVAILNFINTTNRYKHTLISTNFKLIQVLCDSLNYSQSFKKDLHGELRERFGIEVVAHLVKLLNIVWSECIATEREISNTQTVDYNI